MSNVYYGEKSVKELDQYYGADSSEEWIREECELIQKAFKKHGIELTLIECKNLYEWYSDKNFCAVWTGSVKDGSLDDIYNLLYHQLEFYLVDRTNRLLNLVEQLKEESQLKKFFVLKESEE